MHKRETARQRAEALFKPKVAAASAPRPALSPFDSIKSQAALAHSIGKLRRGAPTASADTTQTIHGAQAIAVERREG